MSFKLTKNVILFSLPWEKIFCKLIQVWSNLFSLPSTNIFQCAFFNNPKVKIFLETIDYDPPSMAAYIYKVFFNIRLFIQGVSIYMTRPKFPFDMPLNIIKLLVKTMFVVKLKKLWTRKGSCQCIAPVASGPKFSKNVLLIVFDQLNVKLPTDSSLTIVDTKIEWVVCITAN